MEELAQEVEKVDFFRKVSAYFRLNFERRKNCSTSLSLLSAEKFNYPVSIEWEKKWHPYLPPLDEALAKAETHGLWG